MATVYLAHDLKHARQVAIKVLKPELAAVLGAERFVVEIKTTAALQHPHILPLFDSGTADGFLYYVMPCIQGRRCATNSIARPSLASRSPSGSRATSPAHCTTPTSTA
jgi:serine/threonine protein kinase